MREKQYAFERGFETMALARKSQRAVANKLVRELKRKGLKKFSPPQGVPFTSGYECDYFAGCRVLIGWLPDWLPNRFAGQFVCRADTLAE